MYINNVECLGVLAQVEGASPPWTPTGFHTAREDLPEGAAIMPEPTTAEGVPSSWPT